MRNLKWEIVKKSKVKNSIGEVTNTYEPTGFIYSSNLMPLNFMMMADSIKEYGFSPDKTFKVLTRDAVKGNMFIRSNNEVYQIRRVEKYPRHSTCYVEVVQ